MTTNNFNKKNKKVDFNQMDIITLASLYLSCWKEFKPSNKEYWSDKEKKLANDILDYVEYDNNGELFFHKVDLLISIKNK